MPWAPADSRSHTKKANTPKKQSVWAKVSTERLAHGASESSAIRQANAVIGRMADGGYGGLDDESDPNYFRQPGVPSAPPPPQPPVPEADPRLLAGLGPPPPVPSPNVSTISPPAGVTPPAPRPDMQMLAGNAPNLPNARPPGAMGAALDPAIISQPPPPPPPPATPRYQPSPQEQAGQAALMAEQARLSKPTPKWQTALAIAASVLPRTRPIAGMIAPNQEQRRAHLAQVSNMIADNARQQQQAQWQSEDRATSQQALADYRKQQTQQAGEASQVRRLGLMPQGWEPVDESQPDRYQTVETIGGKRMGLIKKTLRVKEEAEAKKEGEQANWLTLSPEVAEFHNVPEGTRLPANEWAQMTTAASKPAPRVPPRPGIVGEYEYYVDQEKQAGREPKSFTDYQNEDANRRRSVTHINMGGLDPRQANLFHNIVNKYQSSPLIRAADKTPVLIDAISALKKDPNNGALQLPVIYSYIKALDMYDSAVREGEISLTKETMSWKDKLESYVAKVTKGQVLNDRAALEMAKSAENLVASMKQAAASKSKSFESEANVLGLGRHWKDYAAGFSASYDKPREGVPGTVDGGGQVQVTDPKGKVHTFPDAASANRFKKLAGIK